MPGAGPEQERLARADLLLWIAQGLLPPDPDRQARWILDRDGLDELARRSGLAHRGGGALLARVAELAHETGLDERRREHARLFDGPQACPPNETAYVRRDKGVILSDIAGFHRAFGFALAPGAGEKDDHVVAELEFAAMLLVMLAAADRHGNVEASEVTRNALAGFAEDHLGVWIGPFCRRLGTVARLPFYAELARLAEAAWSLTVEREGLPAAEPPEPAAPERDAGTPYECGLEPQTGPEAAAVRSRRGKAPD